MLNEPARVSPFNIEWNVRFSTRAQDRHATGRRAQQKPRRMPATSSRCCRSGATFAPRSLPRRGVASVAREGAFNRLSPALGACAVRGVQKCDRRRGREGGRYKRTPPRSFSPRTAQAPSAGLSLLPAPSRAFVKCCGDSDGCIGILGRRRRFRCCVYDIRMTANPPLRAPRRLRRKRRADRPIR